MVAILKTTQIQEPSSATANISLDSSGNVGIGTTTPAYKLHVADTSTATIGSFRDLDVTAVGAASSIISIGARNGSTFTAGAQITGVLENPATTGYLTFSTRSGGANSERMRIDSSGYMQGTVNGLGAGRIPAMQYFRLNSDLAGANATGAQNVFGVGVTLVGSTQYAFEASVVLTKTAGTTSHTVALGFGGTATINNILYQGRSNYTASSIPFGLNTAGNDFATNSSSSLVVSTAITSATEYFQTTYRGTVSINAGGTFIPQYTLSAAPGGAYSTVAGSYFLIYPLAASGSNVSIGSWA